MMSLKDVQAAASALANQLSAGVPVHDAAQRMARFQPGYAQFWREVAAGAASGQALSSYLAKQWPPTLVNVVRAGEESGTLPTVLADLEQTVELQREMLKLVGQLAYPLGFGALGLGVFVFFMVQVIPALSTSLGVGNRGFVFELSAWMCMVVERYWVVVVAGLAGGGAALVHWLSNAANRSRCLDWMLRVPVLGDALQHIVFGLWARQLALISANNSIPVKDGLIMSSASLPPSLRVGVEQVAAEAVGRGLADATDPDKQSPGDSRAAWPFYIGNAFLIAEETGRLDTELVRAANAMLKHGRERLKVALLGANAAALLVSAVLIVAPLAAYYVQLGIALADAMKG